jgi:hypothetical protein
MRAASPQDRGGQRPAPGATRDERDELIDTLHATPAVDPELREVRPAQPDVQRVRQGGVAPDRINRTSILRHPLRFNA